jgi:AcrR family transcriptional regulator
VTAAAPARRQEERSRSTRLRVLEAAVECLVELGWSGTTTTVVAERAGVSRGAQLHHYPTKSALVVAAVEHLAERRAAELRAEASTLPPGGDRIAQTVGLLGSLFTGPLFAAAIEVWVAARSDPALRATLVPLEARFGREVHRMTVQLLGADETRPGVRESVQATLDLLRGLGVASLLTDDSVRRGRLLAVWSQQLRTALGESAQPGPQRPAGAPAARGLARDAHGPAIGGRR